MATEEKKDAPLESEGEYIGPLKVFGLQREEFTTPSGGEVVRVLFESGDPKIMPLRAYKLLATKTPIDFTTLGNKKIDFMKNMLVEMMMEYDCTSLEAQTLLNATGDTISNMFDKASHVALTKEIYGRAQIASWVPGANFSHYRTMLECDSLVRRAMKDDNSKPSQEAGADAPADK